MFATLGYYICIPFAWLLRVLYELTMSYGWALVLFTVVIKLVLLPFQIKSKKSMMRMSRFQPMIKEIQTRYKNNQVKMNEEMQRLYAEEGINPMSGCLWSFLPFPILIALYSIIRQPITRFMMLTTTAMQGVIDAVETAGFDLSAIAMVKDGVVSMKDGLTQLQPYGQIALVKAAQELGVTLPEGWINMDFSFLGMDLTLIPKDALGQLGTGGWAVIGVLLIPVISGALSFWQSKVTMAGNPAAADPGDPTARSTRMMMWMMPVMSLWIGFTLPASLGVYWIANSILMLVQEKALNKYFKKSMAAEDEAREKKRNEDRIRRMEEARVAQQQRDEKKSLKEKQRAAQAAKAAKAEKAKRATTENGRIGDRPYARGRSFNADHYGE
ncbi:YidC/Oxa1 family membrane protein insertase [Oscillibacter valericigenes]|nr:YidC/Oxa1 family membrane protein insertase [Oscillibacter valericigenes]